MKKKTIEFNSGMAIKMARKLSPIGNGNRSYITWKYDPSTLFPIGIRCGSCRRESLAEERPSGSSSGYRSWRRDPPTPVAVSLWRAGTARARAGRQQATRGVGTGSRTLANCRRDCPFTNTRARLCNRINYSYALFSEKIYFLNRWKSGDVFALANRSEAAPLRKTRALPSYYFYPTISSMQ